MKLYLFMKSLLRYFSMRMKKKFVLFVRLCHIFLLFAVVNGDGGKDVGVIKSGDTKETKETVDSTKKLEGSHAHHIAHRLHTGEDWVQSFIWNLLGYGVIIIPAYFAVKIIKTSNFYENEGEGFFFRTIQCCVYGSSKPSSPLISKKGRCFPTSFTSSPAFKLIFCVIGLQGSYLTWGVLQEKVMTTEYGQAGHYVKFKNSEFLVFMNRITAFLVSGVYIMLTGVMFNGPFYRYSFSSLSNICSSWCQYEALKFVSFPTQVLGKASKMIPVMLMGKLVSKKSYQKYEYIVAVMISIGVTMFLLSTAKDKHTSAETTLSGFILMIGYMGFDSFTSNWQSKLFKEYHVSSMQMMFNVNSFSSLFTLVPLLLSGGLTYSIDFIRQYPSFGTHVFIISLTSATGQLFIFYTISEFGALIFTLIMVTRQMISILLSCIIYRHVLTADGVIGVVIVFVALFLQVYAKYRMKKREIQALSERRESDMA